MIKHLLLILPALLGLSACDLNFVDDNDKKNEPSSPLSLEGVWQGKRTSTFHYHFPSENFQSQGNVEVDSFFIIRKNQSGHYQIQDCREGFADISIENNKFSLDSIEYKIINENEISAQKTTLDKSYGLQEHHYNIKYTKLSALIKPVGIIKRNWSNIEQTISQSNISCVERRIGSASNSNGQYSEEEHIYLTTEFGHEYFALTSGSNIQKYYSIEDDTDKLQGVDHVGIQVSVITSDSSEIGFSTDYQITEEQLTVSGNIEIDVTHLIQQ